MSNTISPELLKQIEQEAEHYANVEIGEKAKFIQHPLSDQWDIAKEGYEDGAEPYALKWQQAEQLIEQMAKALDAIIGTNHDNHEKVILKTKALAIKALNDFNNYKQGKDGN
jgi:hypothetical protein